MDKMDTDVASCPNTRPPLGSRVFIRVHPVHPWLLPARRLEPITVRMREGMNRSTLRGSRKVNVQWRLYCMVHNLEKVGRFGTGNN